MHSLRQQKAVRFGKNGCASFKAIPMGCLKETERSPLEIQNLCLLLPFIAVFRPKHLITSLFSQPCNEQILPSSLFSWDDCQIVFLEESLKAASLFSSMFWSFFSFRWICWKTLKSKESQIVLYEIKRVFHKYFYIERNKKCHFHITYLHFLSFLKCSPVLGF